MSKYLRSKRKKPKKKELPIPARLGLFSLAVLASVIDVGFSVVHGMVVGASTRSPARAATKIARGKVKGPEPPPYYYEILKDATENSFFVTVHRLKKRGLLIDDKGGNLKVSKEGFLLVKESSKPKVIREEWDGKWRLVSFDIPEKIRHHRKWLRYALLNAEFKDFHKSVFTGKYPLPKSVYREIRNRGLEKYIRMMTVGEVSNEDIFFD